MTSATITCPGGLTGLAVEPWTPGEIYAVAANWTQASAPVLAYGEQGWRQTGHQVADYRHRPALALALELRSALHCGGDDSDDAIINDIVSDAYPIAPEH
ncbi:MAG: hypothetical protein IT180_05170 [Acidobacteria bacterium]|nr:hypothetical protein [Acidobacteriota bacterium]